MRFRGAAQIAVLLVGGLTAFACSSTTGESVFVPPPDPSEVDSGPSSTSSVYGFATDTGDGGPSGACKPRTCAEADANCGPIGDGCGGTVDCGACTAPDVCGGGGKPSTCGRSPCVPKTCTGQGVDCGPAPDGCGGLIASCGTCTAPQFCGGGGPSKCGDGSTTTAPDGGACVPTTCGALGANCGPAADGCGGLIPSCGTCTAPQTCGGGGTPSVCGGSAGCVPTTCAKAGKDCGPIADGCGGLTASCGSCAPPAICGGAGSPNNCGGGSVTCVNLCLKQTTCPGGGDTTVSGMVVSPAENLPIFGALVYVPNDTVGALPTGLSCDQCGASALGKPLVSVKTGADGKFVLKNMPVGMNIPLVIQLGKWRRQVTIPNVASCTNTALPTSLTHLPKNKAEGDIPLTAISTGSVDALECVLRKIGISDSEFTPGAGNGRIHMYQDNGAVAPAGGVAQTNAAALYGSQTELDKHDMVIFGCVASRQDKAAADKQRVINYANKGGRVYATHYSYVWLYNQLPWSSTGKWAADSDSWNSVTAEVDTTFPKGASFASWLNQPLVNALSNVTPPRIVVNEARHDLDEPIASPAQGWLRTVAPTKPAVLHYTFNTEWGQTSDKQCGRVLFSDFHVTTNSSTQNVVFPNECTNTALTPQEKVLAFMLFDLASCVQVDDPPPPTCTPKTCATLTPPAGCGPAGDGCGGVLDCGPCVAPKTCGGGGTPYQCGAPSCVKKTCASLGYNCGAAADGCGGSLDCGPCTIPGQICGGGGPSKCGGGACAPKTCSAQSIDCGMAGDTCGGSLDCGACPPTYQCIGGKCAAPSCTPKTCASLGYDCGAAADGCGGLLDCGACTGPGETCGGGGFTNRCGGGLK